MTYRQLAKTAAGLYELCINAESNGDNKAAITLSEALAIVHGAAGALQLAVSAKQNADRLRKLTSKE
ncbi:MAG: hypothetical protein P4N59_13210 [Negativicutes bacterium]|nr:hypothetical protein [Negativicutes bacterium]